MSHRETSGRLPCRPTPILLSAYVYASLLSGPRTKNAHPFLCAVDVASVGPRLVRYGTGVEEPV